MSKYLRFLMVNLRSPSKLIRLLKALTKGLYYLLWFRLKNRNIIIKFPFLCYSKVEITGPGSVLIDRFCSVFTNTFEHLAIMTLSPKSEVHIGRNCTLGGLTIRCKNKVIIGNNVLTAANLIQDAVIFRSQGKQPHTDLLTSNNTIKIGNNVWLGGQAIILAGSNIEDGGVLGVNALLLGKEVGKNYLATGNPVLRPIPISKVQSLAKAKDK